MLSLNAKILFTNVPIQGALSCLEKRLREFHYSSIEIEEILSLVHLYVKQTANEEIYSSSIASHRWSINHYFDFSKACIVSSPISRPSIWE